MLSLCELDAFISSKHGKESMFVAAAITAGIMFLLTIITCQNSYNISWWMGAMFIVMQFVLLSASLAASLSPNMPIRRLCYILIGPLIMIVHIYIARLMSANVYTSDMDILLLILNILALFLCILRLILDYTKKSHTLCLRRPTSCDHECVHFN
ncbi:hypothetical protein BsWGS_15302 [Bradybaena similaris]